jgi:hypothetical protein
MLTQCTITVAAVAACGVTLAFGASVVVQPRLVHLSATVAPAFQSKLRPADGGGDIPHKFMRRLPRAL